MPQYDESFLDSSIFRRRVRTYSIQKKSSTKSRSFKNTSVPLLLAVTDLNNDFSDSLSICSTQESNEERSNGKARGGKLARRARSFKEDFLEKLSHMRSPGSGGTGTGGVESAVGGVGRASSPSSPRIPRDKNGVAGIGLGTGGTSSSSSGKDNNNAVSLEKNPLRDLHVHVRQVQLALLHFRDVVSKKKLEMLPGNGTVVLDTVTTIHTVLKSYLLYENSSTLGSATNQVYQALAQLLKLCDDVLLHGDQSSALDTENVTHIIGLVEEAVKNLVSLAHEKISNRQKPVSITINNRASGYGLELAPQRNSLPDIPLTPREREILEQTAANNSLVRSSHSSESILRDSSPPPKPPLPDRTNVCFSEENSSSGTPPPLPPKRRTRTQQLLDESESFLASSLDRVSLRSRSPEDSSSILSASAGSLDSALNHSRDEDEIRAIMGPNDESLNDSMDLSLIATIKSIDGKIERFSTQTHESGFVSMHSQRSSSQSYTTASSTTSKRSSQQSSISYNSQTFSTQQQSLYQQKFTSDSNGSVFMQKTMSSSKSTADNMNITESGDTVMLEKLKNEMESITISDANGIPPALPEKRSKRRRERQPSQYDNVPENEHLSTCSLHTSNGDSSDTNKPPPLPLKKKHMFQSVAYSVMAYMEMFGNCSHSNNDFISGLGTRHSVAAYNSMQAEWQQHEMALTTTQSCSFMAHTITNLHDTTSVSISMTPNITEITNNSSLPPALPPKRSRSIKSNATPSIVSPKATISMQSIHTSDPILSLTPVRIDEPSYNDAFLDKKDVVSSTPVKLNTTGTAMDIALPISRPVSNALSSVSISDNTLELRDIDQDDNILEELDISKYLVFKKPDEEGPDIRGGHPDALLIHATKANKHDEKESDFLYQEAFLTTYRTFMQPLELIQKLHKRHQRFSCSPDVTKQRAAREAFSLLVRVVSDLTMSDLDDTLLQTLMEFVQQLVCSGDLTMAKALRVKILEKHAAKQLQYAQPILSSLSVTTKQASLLDFKSEQIAEQMTLLDADLFMKIEIPEVLIWAQEQNEERSPNLTRFTEHFNKMSYWARSRILEHRLENEAKDREKYVVKFIKIMKHLRKINNFNSYLALLSALDSAPIRRLEWQKHITEGLKEYCALIDSSSSFRAYRQALAETQPPCIPYIGLVLQDLTFVHIGNSDLLPDGTINFSKRWQQFNIVENMKRFKKGTYSFKKHDRIITFFNNFSDFLCEEAMWQISESIKPRGGKKVQLQN
ncbi:guanine nucleotide-releasing factor 2 isoform X4 [Vespula pensylvanica]|uniref:guanine nucleotide-releasing factor 2 isoform X4 n=1 Tax=Vespula pensylvanica TaxID=30213 RepID=UPI001CB9EB60|nr:guanine nucleotide-releasing factor 2 isoform X4 [Vespula pensylvanica]